MPARKPADAGDTLTINRAPVLTLWVAVVAERLGYDADEAVTLGRSVAGLNAAAKAKAIGLAEPGESKTTRPRAAKEVELFGRHVPVTKTADGLRALDKGKPIAPESVHRYLEGKFGDRLDDVRAAMRALARSVPKATLAERGMTLYEAFRPAVPRGTRGWGAKGVLDLATLRALAHDGGADR